MSHGLRIARSDLLGDREPRELRRAVLDAMAVSDPITRRERLRSLGDRRTPELLTFAGQQLVAPVMAHALLEAWGDDDFPARAECERIAERLCR